MSAFRYVPVEALVASVLLALVLATVAAAPALRRGDQRAAARRAARVLLAGALLAMLVATMAGGDGGPGVNLVPGAGIRSALANPSSDLTMLNLAGNVVMFAPVGFLLPLATPLRPAWAVAACLALSVAVELLQLVTGRSLDVDDVLLNTLGGALGAGLALPLVRLSRDRRTGDPRSRAGAGTA